MTPQEHLAVLAPDAAIPDLMEWILAAGRATTQTEYERAYHEVFERLDRLVLRLADQRFLGGAAPGDEDWAYYAVLIRFDAVYYGLFKLNRTRVVDLPQVGDWLRDLFQRPGVADSLDLAEVQRAAYRAHPTLNPKGTWPRARPDHWLPHDRARFDRAARRAEGLEETGVRRVQGEWVRGRSGFRDVIEDDPDATFSAEPGRYHLYLANNCPWCHRVALTRGILGLEDVISVDTLFYRRHAERGWQFRPDVEGFGGDSVNGVGDVLTLYERLGSSERSVPILWDKVRATIVNNESGEIVRMLHQGFRRWATGPDLLPADRVDEVDALNAWIYRDVNNGAYKAGFTDSQSAYAHAFDRFFAALAHLDERLSTRRWLCGDQITEADIRLFPTIFRFDAIYYTRFKLNLKRVREHRHLQRWHDELLALPGAARASNLDHAKRGYFGRHGNQLIPVGPVD